MHSEASSQPQPPPRSLHHVKISTCSFIYVYPLVSEQLYKLLKSYINYCYDGTLSEFFLNCHTAGSCKDKEQDPSCNAKEEVNADIAIIEPGCGRVVVRVEALLDEKQLLVVDFLHSLFALLATDFEEVLEKNVLSEPESHDQQESKTPENDKNGHNTYSSVTIA